MLTAISTQFTFPTSNLGLSLLSGQFSKSQGWPLNRGLTVVWSSEDKGVAPINLQF